jgi:hypothetical protein
LNTTSNVDLEIQLQSNLNNVIGSPSLDLNCSHDTTLERFSFDVTIIGGINGSSTTLTPQASLLPEWFPALDLSIPTLDFGYEAHFSLNINAQKAKFTIGETKLHFFTNFLATASQALPVLPSTNVSFNGHLGMDVQFNYSSFGHGWTYHGGYLGSLDAEVNAAPGVTSLGLRAMEDDMFDDKPREYLHIWFSLTHQRIIEYRHLSFFHSSHCPI